MALLKKDKKIETPKASDTNDVVDISAVQNPVIVNPMLSEKSLKAEGAGTYTFVVKPNATKIDVKREVEARYGVKPTDVRMVNVEGKRTRFGVRRGKRSDWKKAMVTLPKGKTISIHEGV